MKKILVIVFYIFFGCSSLEGKRKETEVIQFDRQDILGIWFYNPKGEKFIKLDLKSDGSFDVFQYSCTSNKLKSRAGGVWSLEGERFQLEWPNFTKSQTVKTLNKELLILRDTPDRGERYFRLPKYRESGAVCGNYIKNEPNS